MSNVYVDRGIIKWNPYDALIGYQSMLQEMRYRLGKKEKPVLMEDAIETMNRNLSMAVEFDAEIALSYFHDGYVRTTHGRVRRIDSVFLRVVLEHGEAFQTEDILEITLLERTKEEYEE